MYTFREYSRIIFKEIKTNIEQEKFCSEDLFDYIIHFVGFIGAKYNVDIKPFTKFLIELDDRNEFNMKEIMKDCLTKQIASFEEKHMTVIAGYLFSNFLLQEKRPSNNFNKVLVVKCNDILSNDYKPVHNTIDNISEFIESDIESDSEDEITQINKEIQNVQNTNQESDSVDLDEFDPLENTQQSNHVSLPVLVFNSDSESESDTDEMPKLVPVESNPYESDSDSDTSSNTFILYGRGGLGRGRGRGGFRGRGSFRGRGRGRGGW